MTANSRQSFVAALAARYGHRLRRFISTRARNVSDVPDLAQEVFLRLMRVEQHEVIRSPEAYLFTVASHVVHQHTLREVNTPHVVDITELLTDLQLASTDDPSANAEIQQRLAALQRALDRLPARQRTALLLHRFAGTPSPIPMPSFANSIRGTSARNGRKCDRSIWTTARCIA